MNIIGEYINGLDFPVCNAFKPKILDGELCYVLKFSSESNLEGKSGRGKGLLLAIDNGISIEPTLNQNLVAKSSKSKEFIRTELKSTGNRARLHVLTSHRHDDSRPGKYAMKSLKVMTATENFLAMPDDVKRCQLEAKEDCRSWSYVEEVQKMCGCIPWSSGSVAFTTKVRIYQIYKRLII